MRRGFGEEGPAPFFEEGSESSSHPDVGWLLPYLGIFTGDRETPPPPTTKGFPDFLLRIYKPPEIASVFVSKIQVPGMRYHSFDQINICVTSPTPKTVKMDGLNQWFPNFAMH